MDGIKKSIWDVTRDVKAKLEASSSSLGSKYVGGEGRASGISSVLSPPQDAPLIVTRHSSGQVVSLWTCSKLCAIFFVAGVFVGYTLKRRVRRLASKLLRRLKDE